MAGEALNTIFAIIGWSLLGICLMLGCYAFILIAASIGAKARGRNLDGGRGRKANPAQVRTYDIAHRDGSVTP